MQLKFGKDPFNDKLNWHLGLNGPISIRFIYIYGIETKYNQLTIVIKNTQIKSKIIQIKTIYISTVYNLNLEGGLLALVDVALKLL